MAWPIPASSPSALPDDGKRTAGERIAEVAGGDGAGVGDRSQTVVVWRRLGVADGRCRPKENGIPEQAVAAANTRSCCSARKRTRRAGRACRGSDWCTAVGKPFSPAYSGTPRVVMPGTEDWIGFTAVGSNPTSRSLFGRVHSGFILIAQPEIQGQLGGGAEVVLDEHAVVVDVVATAPRQWPDVALVGSPSSRLARLAPVPTTVEFGFGAGEAGAEGEASRSSAVGVP